MPGCAGRGFEIICLTPPSFRRRCPNATATGEIHTMVISGIMTRVRYHAEALVLRSLVPIYSRPNGNDFQTRQIGSGFLVAHNGRPTLVTAKHVLFGHRDDENPGEKYIVFGGSLRPLSELAPRDVYSGAVDDLTAVHVDEIELGRCLPESCLVGSGNAVQLLTIFGLLSRDFRRDLKRGILSPKPFVYTNRAAKAGPGHVALLYPRARNRDASSGNKVRSPEPVGMSGCPILHTGDLLRGAVGICGVFTEYRRERGIGHGESAHKILALLAGIAP